MTKETCTIDPALAKSLRRSLALETHGTVAQQQKDLVALILNTFEDPTSWPMTDLERIGVLRDVYRAARNIRNTECACNP